MVDFSDFSVCVEVKLLSVIKTIGVIVSDDGTEIKRLHEPVESGYKVKRITISNLNPGCFYDIVAFGVDKNGKKTTEKRIIAYTTSYGNEKTAAVNKRESNLGTHGDDQSKSRPTGSIARPKSFKTHSAFDYPSNGISTAEKVFGKKFENDPHLIKIAGGQKQLRRALMDGRKARNLNDYLNHTYKFSRPKEMHKERLQRALVYGNCLIQLHKKTIDNDNLREGYQFFNNTWGMGPFYCYDKNYEDILTEKQRLDGLIHKQS